MPARCMRKAAKPSRIPEAVTPMANKVSSQPRQPRSIALRPVGKLAHCASCTPYSAKKAPPLTASTVCMMRSMAGSLRLRSSTTKSQSVRQISSANSSAMTIAHVPSKAKCAMPRNRIP
ncbi:hypothetical protein D3C80_1710170 [compost metagenome]